MDHVRSLNSANLADPDCGLKRWVVGTRDALGSLHDDAYPIFEVEHRRQIGHRSALCVMLGRGDNRLPGRRRSGVPPARRSISPKRRPIASWPRCSERPRVFGRTSRDSSLQGLPRYRAPAGSPGKYGYRLAGSRLARPPGSRTPTAHSSRSHDLPSLDSALRHPPYRGPQSNTAMTTTRTRLPFDAARPAAAAAGSPRGP